MKNHLLIRFPHIAALCVAFPILCSGQDARPDSDRPPQERRESRGEVHEEDRDAEHRDAEPNPEQRVRVLRERIQRMRGEDGDAHRDGDNRSAEIAELHKLGRHDEANRLTQQNRFGRPGGADQMRQLQHVLTALENLRQAGMSDQAEQLERVADELRAQLRPNNRPGQGRFGDGRGFGRGPAGMRNNGEGGEPDAPILEMRRQMMEMHAQMLEMQRALQDMQNHLRELHEERERASGEAREIDKR